MKAETGTMDAPGPIQLSSLPEQLRHRWASLSAGGRRVLLAYVGLWGYAFDSVNAAYQGGRNWLGTVEDRGVEVQNTIGHSFQQLEKQAGRQVKRFQGDVEESVDQVKRSISSTQSEVEDELEKRVESVLANLGIPSRERLERLSAEIEDLSRRIDLELQKA